MANDDRHQSLASRLIGRIEARQTRTVQVQNAH